MGTIVFLILRVVMHYNWYGDAQTLATLVSLDSVAIVLFLMLRKKKSQ